MSIEQILNVLEQALPILAGLLGIPIIQVLKNLLNLESDQARIGLAGVVSAILAILIFGVAALTGEQDLALSLDGVLGALPVVFSTAVAVFKLLGGNDSPVL